MGKIIERVRQREAALLERQLADTVYVYPFGMIPRMYAKQWFHKIKWEPGEVQVVEPPKRQPLCRFWRWF
jgi:hypothetical protein